MEQRCQTALFKWCQAGNVQGTAAADLLYDWKHLTGALMLKYTKDMQYYQIE